VNRIELPVPEPHGRVAHYRSTVHRLKVRAASTSLPTLFPSSTGSRLSPSSSHGAIHDMAQTGRSNVRYVDPQRRYTIVLGPSWNAPFEALPHDDRAGTHDSADGRCGAYASIRRGQAPTKVFRRYPQSAVCSPLEFRRERRAAGDGASRAHGLTARILERVGRVLQCGILAGLRTGMGLVSRVSPVQTALRTQAAVVKSNGGERCGKVGTRFRQEVERGERKRTVAEVSKAD
jgi:hypothetical protein